jgi:lipid-binding SYLF domain-containing protein
MTTTHWMILALSVATTSCASQELNAAPPPSTEEQAGIEQTIAELKRIDPDIQRFFDEAHGYAVFPDIAKGGLLIGGAGGDGWVYEQGRLVGMTEMTQLSIGAQAGGQSYAEVIFFRDATAMNAFKAGDLELGAEVTAVVLEERASRNAGYDPSGMAVFILPKGGVMAEASVGGQKFSFEPVEGAGR